MNISKLFEDKYTVIFVLLLVLLVSVWVSRTYRNGKFGGWLAPSEGYGSGIIEGLVTTNKLDIPSKYKDGEYCFLTGDVIDEVNFVFRVNTDIPAASSTANPPVSGGKIYINFPTEYFIKPASPTIVTGKLTVFDSGSSVGPDGSLNFLLSNNKIEYIIGGLASAPGLVTASQYKLSIKNLKLGTARPAGTGTTENIYITTSADETTKLPIIKSPAIAANLKDMNYPEKCRLMPKNPVIKVYSGNDENKTALTSEGVNVKVIFTLNNEFVNGERIVLQIPNVTQNSIGLAGFGSYSVDNVGKTITGDCTFSGKPTSTIGILNSYSLTNYIQFTPDLGTKKIPAKTEITIVFSGLTTPATKQSTIISEMATLYASPDNQVIERGFFTFPAITGSSNTGASSSSGTASDGTTYVTSAASSVLISDVKRQSQWAIDAQKAYELAWTKLRNATASGKDAAQTSYDNAVKLRNKLIASHPDSWFDGSAWRYGDDGFVRKCIEPSTLSSNEGNCQNIYKTDPSGNLVKTNDGNNVLLMKKCPWKCSNPGQTGSDACRIDADCVKVIRWATYLPDGTQIEKNLLASSTRSSYDDLTTSSSSSPLNEEDIYHRGITRNFNKYNRNGVNGANGVNDGSNRHERGLFGGIRDAAGNLIRGIGNWIDPDDPQSNKRTNKHNAYYYEDGSPAATAYLGQYNGQSYDEESPYTVASRPTSYYYTTNYYYTDGEQANDGKSNMPGALSSVSPYEPAINL
jgi:hypothetical protein